ncbi:MAG TPA: hypothetical protein VNB24_06570 [Acidimicrobiales bacterium]|nr:hypothetical protein [Acidimicrobiales bacterium]
MRKRVIVTLITVGLAVSGGAIASAQTDAPKDERPARETPKPAAPADKAEKPREPKPERGDAEKRRAEGQKRPGEHGNKGHHKNFGPGMGHAIHGEVLVPVRSEDGSETPRTYETVVFDRGRVVSATDQQLTLERPDGQRVTVALNDNTSFRGVEKGSELREGTPVFVVAKDGVARHVGQPKPHPNGEKRRAEPAPASAA